MEEPLQLAETTLVCGGFKVEMAQQQDGKVSSACRSRNRVRRLQGRDGNNTNLGKSLQLAEVTLVLQFSPVDHDGGRGHDSGDIIF